MRVCGGGAADPCSPFGQEARDELLQRQVPVEHEIQKQREIRAKDDPALLLVLTELAGGDRAATRRKVDKHDEGTSAGQRGEIFRELLRRTALVAHRDQRVGGITRDAPDGVHEAHGQLAVGYHDSPYGRLLTHSPLRGTRDDARAAGASHL